MFEFEGPILILLFVLWLVFLIAVCVALLLLVRPWLRALLTGAPVPVITILAMRLRGSPAMLLVDTYSALRRAGIATTIGEVEAVYLDHRTRVRTSADLVGLIKSKRGPQTMAPAS